LKWLLTFLLFLSAASTSDAAIDDWSTKDQRLYTSFVTLQAMDVLQTFALIECQERNPYCPYHETNPLVGPHPKKGEVVVIKLATNFLIYKMLDKKLNQRERRFTLRALNVVSIYPVIQNEQVGLGFYIPILPYKSFRK
jgi:hypothetical protein